MFCTTIRAIIAKHLNDVKPVVEIKEVALLPRLSNEEVDGSLGDEELVGRVIFLLPPEVPDVESEAIALLEWHLHIPSVYGYALCASDVLLKVVPRIRELPHQAGLAREPSPNQHHLGFVEVVEAFGFINGLEVVPYGIDSLIDYFQRR